MNETMAASKDTILRRLTSILEMHRAGALGGEIMPEDALLDIVPKDTLRTALVKHKVGLQPNKHTQIWHKIAQSLSEAGGAIALIEQHDGVIADLKNTMQKTHKKDFPYLSGPKILNYWLYVMESYCDINWKDRDNISVAPDTHILQASVKLGVAPESVLDGSAASRELVARAWIDLLKDTELSPIDVHTPLWLWSRSGFLEV